MKARVTVMLKTGVLDPQGEAVRLLYPLTIGDAVLAEGMALLGQALASD